MTMRDLIDRPLTIREQCIMSSLRWALFALTIIVAMLCGCRANAESFSTNRIITLRWTYPTNELSTNLFFVVHRSTNVTVPVTNWPVMTNIVGTNLSWKMSILPGEYFFYLTASNFWGESDPSNTVGLPVVPNGQGEFKITRD